METLRPETRLPRILVRERLEAADLRALASSEALLLRIPNFQDPQIGRELARRLARSSRREAYTHETRENGALVQKYYGVDRVGFPFNLTYGAPRDSALTEKYYSEAAHGTALFRELCAPYLSPVDRLRLALDEVMPEGARIASFEGRRMWAGMGRVMRAETSHLSAEQPHYDALPESFARLDAQLAANVYMEVPEIGGELEVWDVTPLAPGTPPPADWRAVLPPPVRVKPLAGELILFNCRRPHAILGFHEGHRVTAQTFLGFRAGKAVELWN